MVCDDVIPFADGELSRDRVRAFREHLPGCRACQERLVDALQLSAQLGSMEPEGDWLLVWHDYLVLEEPVGRKTPEATTQVGSAKRFKTYAEAREWAIGLWDIDVFDSLRVFAISVHQLAALCKFRETHGYRWRSLLLHEWDRSDCEPELRQLRNGLGPVWLYRQRIVR